MHPEHVGELHRRSTGGTATRIPVLTYHSLDDSGSPVSTAPERFRQQMEFLYAKDWRTLRLDQLLAGHELGEWPRRSFVATFDDGFLSFAESALPTLAALGYTATVFVVPDWVGRTNAWPGQPGWVPRRPLMDWADLRAIAQAGVEVGAHSLSHASLTTLTRSEAEREVLTSKQRIEDGVGRPVETFAYPYGETSVALERLVAGHFRAAFGTRLGYATPTSSRFSLQRIDMYYLRHTRLSRLVEAGWLEWYLRSRQLLRDLRRAGGLRSRSS